VNANQVESSYNHLVLSDVILVNSMEIYFKDHSGKEKIGKWTHQQIFIFGLIKVRSKICRLHVMKILWISYEIIFGF